MNPESEIQSLLSQKGPKKAPDELFTRIESSIAGRLRLRKQIRAAFTGAMAACLVLGLLFFSRTGKGHQVNVAQNEAFINTLFSTFSAAENAADSSCGLLSVESDDLQGIFPPEDDTVEVTLVDF